MLQSTGILAPEHPAQSLFSGDLSTDMLTTDQAAELEQRLWPLKVTDTALATYLTPIRPRYAEALFDEALARQTLFPRELHLGVAREHVYYRSPRGPSLRTPARLLWYVSGESQRAGVQSARAVSRLQEVVVDKPERLYARFRHLGIYELSDVERAARGGRAMALRFSETELLPCPVPYQRLRDMASEHGHTLVVRSASEIPPPLFAEVYREALRERRQP